jgi:hypothetical protein
MIDVTNKKCKEDNCNKQSIFNLPNEKIGIYCNQHKKENMVNVVDKKCLEKDCEILCPVFNLPNEKIGIYCNKHKKENMINLKSPRCQDCNALAAYNLENIRPPIYCNEHKKDSMIDICHKRCLQEHCDIFVTNKYKQYCLRCFINLFPDEKISKNYKVKENHMTDFIKEHFKEEVIIFDKTVGGCSKRRPDVYIDKFTHVIVIECDENQHTRKEYTNCENKRTMELFQDFGNRPIIFIRFNPDSYINKDGKKILSSFKNHKTLFVPIIRKQEEWNNRLTLLKETILKCLTDIPEKEVTYEHLFYDQKKPEE